MRKIKITTYSARKGKGEYIDIETGETKSFRYPQFADGKKMEPGTMAMIDPGGKIHKRKLSLGGK
jgi:hypothetical protein